MIADPAPDSDDREDLHTTLVLRLRSGDGQAARLLERLYRDALRRFCFGYLHNVDDAEDAVQEVFCTVLADETVPSDFRSWIYKVARNHCIDRLRAKLARPEMPGLPSDPDVAATITGDLTRLVRHERVARVLAMLSKLPHEQREPLWLRYTEDLSRPEVAKVLGLPESIVKTRCHEGLERIRRELDALRTGPSG